MAKRREYAYYEKAGKLSLVEKAGTIQDGLNYVYDADNGLDIPSGSGYWKSPTESVATGLRIEYAYSPMYRIDTLATTVGGDSYTSDSGFLKIVDAGNGLPTSGVTHIVIEGCERWNGLHTVKTLNAGYTILETKYNGGSVTEAFTIYTDVDAITDEDDDIDIPVYLTKAIVPYLKARIAEDRGEMELKEYHMREFHRMINNARDTKIAGPRSVVPGINWQR